MQLKLGINILYPFLWPFTDGNLVALNPSRIQTFTVLHCSKIGKATDSRDSQ